jgi:hypothetical protein
VFGLQTAGRKNVEFPTQATLKKEEGKRIGELNGL